MARQIWIDGTETEIAAFVRQQDRRFCEAIVAAHPSLASGRQLLPPPRAKREIAALAVPVAEAPKRARDWLVLSDAGSLPQGEATNENTWPKWRQIASQVARKHGVSMADLVSHRRDKQIAAARQEAMWRLKAETSMTLPAIGRRFNRDHTTVLYSVRKYAQTAGSAAS